MHSIHVSFSTHSFYPSLHLRLKFEKKIILHQFKIKIKIHMWAPKHVKLPAIGIMVFNLVIFEFSRVHIVNAMGMWCLGFISSLESSHG